MQLDFRHARFLKSANALSDLPADDGREVAFAGRSNAGKSSALNAISGVGGLARVSKTPGRTQLINFFTLAGQYRLVDLPGYGYARVPPSIRLHWARLMEDYFTARASLAGLVLVMDMRHPLTDFDRQMLAWVTPLGRPVLALLTKADKLSRSARLKSCGDVKTVLAGQVEVLAFSAVSAEGVEAARTRLEHWLTDSGRSPKEKNPGV